MVLISNNNKFNTETIRFSLSNQPVQIIEVKIVDQFNYSLWDDLITEYNTPKAICGYVAFAVGLYLSNVFPITSFTHNEVEELVESVSQLNNIRPTVKNLMESLHGDRSGFISKNNSFTNEKAQNYMCNWVANYEIGDWMSNLFPLTKNLHFLRCIERGKVFDEELKRCEVEDFLFNDYKIFIESLPRDQPINQIGIESGAKELPHFIDPLLSHFHLNELKHSALFKKTLLFKPSEWYQYQSENSSSNSIFENSPTFVVDGLGHFVVAKPIEIDGVKTLLVLNSSSSPISEKSMFTLLAKLVLLGETEISDPSFLEII